MNRGGRKAKPRTTVEEGLQIFLTIETDPSFPDALSYDQLKDLLQAAIDDQSMAWPGIDEDELIRAALSAWADQTKELIHWIEKRGDSLGTTRSPKQLMALGSFRTHMAMGLKALKYAER